MARVFLYVRDQLEGTNEQCQTIADHVTELKTALEGMGFSFRGSANLELDPEPPPPDPPPPEGGTPAVTHQLKFLQTTPSLIPDRPFEAGQIITITGKLTPEMLRWVRDGFAAIVPSEPAIEAAIEPVAKARGAR